MARWQRRPQPSTIVHADRGSQYTSWLFGHRLRPAGLLGSMGGVASSVDNALVESAWSSMQRELLDRRSWTSRTDLASSMFEWIEGQGQHRADVEVHRVVRARVYAQVDIEPGGRRWWPRAV